MDGKVDRNKKVEFVSDHSSLLSLQPWVFRKESCPNGEEKIRVDGELDRVTSASQSEASPRNVSLRYGGGGGGRGRSCLRSKHSCRYSVKPVVSAGNCLIPQLYNEDSEFGECGFNLFPSSAGPALRPLVITDGRRIISRSTYDPSCVSFGNGLHNEVGEASLGRTESVVGIPPLPLLRSPDRNIREAQHVKRGTEDTRRTCKSSNLQDSPDRILLLRLGINIGVISTILSNRREVERLNDLLKHNENLVQDLQEELEMKESLTVKELPDEACESKELKGSYTNMGHSLDSLKTHDPSSFPSQEKDGHDCLCLPKSRGTELSKIEAELEYELERLELNMNATSLEGRISALGEMDPDLIGDVVQGELREDMLEGEARRGQVDVKRDSNGTSTTETHDVNYAVSPRELSLRLHEVIQFRLEERVKELENALRCSQKEIEFMEDEMVLSQSQRSFSLFSNSENGPSPCKESPTLVRQDSSLSQALCINLTGDALNAYDEAYEEFMRIADTPDHVPYMTDTSNEVQGDELSPLDGSIARDPEDGNEGKTSVDINCFRTEVQWEQMLSRSFSDGESDNNTDDEEGKLLIQQIIERRKQGSPLVVHAQRMLYAMED